MYKVGQTVIYEEYGEFFVTEIKEIEGDWFRTADKGVMQLRQIIEIVADVSPPARTERHTVPVQRIQRGQGAFTYDNKLKPLHEQITAFLHGAMSVSKQNLIDRAIDTGDKELFLRLTTQHT